MTAPIKTPPQRPAPMERPASLPRQPPLHDVKPALSGTGRGPAPASRSATSSVNMDTPMAADGLLFSQLLVRAVSAEPDQQGFGGGGISLPVRAEPLPTQLIDELAQRLPDQPDGPLQFTLLMPHLGSVRVDAHQADNRWSIKLGFARRDVLKRLHGQVGACRDSLAQALGQAVDLDLHEDLGA